jgi:hypothetical protein
VIHGVGFIEHWLSRLLYWRAPPWVFTTAYTLFGLAVAAAWWRYPPEIRRRGPAARSGHGRTGLGREGLCSVGMRRMCSMLRKSGEQRSVHVSSHRRTRHDFVTDTA